MTSPPTKRVIAAVRRGDENACRSLIDHLYPVIIPIVRKNLPHRDDEEDLLQEIFAKIFSRIRQYSGSGPIVHWASRIAVNTCYDQLRRQKTRPTLSFGDLDADEIQFLKLKLAQGPERMTELGGEIAGELLNKLLTTLSTREQAVIRLLDLEENSVLDVCKLTGWGTSKVKVTAMRARRKLQVALARLEQATL
ncbi:MAG: RNA polymerase sigma factor [Verrucomicrobiales bacterium]